MWETRKTVLPKELTAKCDIGLEAARGAIYTLAKVVLR
jgi:hypothetical protein